MRKADIDNKEVKGTDEVKGTKATRASKTVKTNKTLKAKKAAKTEIDPQELKKTAEKLDDIFGVVEISNEQIDSSKIRELVTALQNEVFKTELTVVDAAKSADSFEKELKSDVRVYSVEAAEPYVELKSKDEFIKFVEDNKISNLFKEVDDEYIIDPIGSFEGVGAINDEVSDFLDAFYIPNEMDGSFKCFNGTDNFSKLKNYRIFLVEAFRDFIERNCETVEANSVSYMTFLDGISYGFKFETKLEGVEAIKQQFLEAYNCLASELDGKLAQIIFDANDEVDKIDKVVSPGTDNNVVHAVVVNELGDTVRYPCLHFLIQYYDDIKYVSRLSSEALNTFAEYASERLGVDIFARE